MCNENVTKQKFNEHNNNSARALSIFVHFFAVNWKTTWNDEALRSVRNANDSDKFSFFNLKLNAIIEKFTDWRVNSTLLISCEKPTSHESRSVATWANLNVFCFCEPHQCAKNGNPFKVNVNAFSLSFEPVNGFQFGAKFTRHSFSVIRSFPRCFS